jgi:hypothetical protein
MPKTTQLRATLDRLTRDLVNEVMGALAQSVMSTRKAGRAEDAHRSETARRSGSSRAEQPSSGQRRGEGREKARRAAGTRAGEAARGGASGGQRPSARPRRYDASPDATEVENPELLLAALEEPSRHDLDAAARGAGAPTGSGARANGTANGLLDHRVLPTTDAGPTSRVTRRSRRSRTAETEPTNAAETASTPAAPALREGEVAVRTPRGAVVIRRKREGASAA